MKIKERNKVVMEMQRELEGVEEGGWEIGWWKRGRGEGNGGLCEEG
jgi:hypothetical protein